MGKSEDKLMSLDFSLLFGVCGTHPQYSESTQLEVGSWGTNSAKDQLQSKNFNPVPSFGPKLII